MLLKLFKVLAAVTLTGLATQSCALRPRFNDLVAKEETATELRFQVVEEETRSPVVGANVEMGEGKDKVTRVTDGQGIVKLPVTKRYRDDNSVLAVTRSSGMPRYVVQRLDGVAPAGEVPAIPEAAPAAAAPAKPAAGKFDFKPANSANAMVVLYRNTAGLMGSGSMLGATIKVNREPVGDLPHDTYVVVELPPGRHTVTALSAAGESNWIVQLAAGAVEYAQLQPMPFRLQSKTADEALTEMRADSETLSLSARANFGAPVAAPDPNVKQM